MSLLYIDGSDFVRAVKGGTIRLETNRDRVDQLNVFPVPDGDTGTNMFLTLQSAVKEGEKAQDQPLKKVARSVSMGSLMGARGNSGVIMSQIFRGIAKELETRDKADAREMALALKTGSKTAYEAVMKPVEGTILTIIREVSDACEKESKNNSDLIKVLLAGLRVGYQTLDKTPLMLPVLKEAGVVDAGGQGLLFFLEGFIEALAFENEVAFDGLRLGPETREPEKLPVENMVPLAFRYCTEMLVKGNNLSLDQIRTTLADLGDSLLVVGDDTLLKVHVHTNHPGRVLETGLQHGIISDIKINNMQDEVHEHRNQYEEAAPEQSPEIGLVAVGTGSGVIQILQSLGVDQVIEGGQTMNPSTEDLVKACQKVKADSIIIFPNNSNIVMAARQAAQLISDRVVRIVPTHSIMQCITALIAFNPDGDVDEIAASMEAEIQRVKYAEVTVAVRDSSVNGLSIQEGDSIGIIGDRIEVSTSDLDETMHAVLLRMVDDSSELITLFYGEDINTEEVQRIQTYIEETYPNCEVEVHYGGQPYYRYYVSVE